ncbi:hypothetical protein D4R49_00730 [bacterium]|nr:MAG: hypothetical protein D4R49_00730 [bacterium]
MKFLKIFIIVSVLSWVTSTLSDVTKDDWNTGYRVVTFTTELKEMVKSNPKWKVCGDYFAEVGMMGERIILISFAEKPSVGLPAVPMIAFSKVEWISISINEKMASPLVIFLRDEQGDKLLLRMNLEDYKTGLPCFGKGTEI